MDTINKIINRIHIFYSLGVIYSIKCKYNQLKVALYYVFFDFDKWHIYSTFQCRPYKKIVVDMVNSLNVDSVLEVGCGMCDILGRVNSKAKIGVDSDIKILNVSRIIYKNKINLVHSDLKNLDLKYFNNIDCLIMVNWIHCISPEELHNILSPILPKIKYLVVDSIRDDAEAELNYKYRHDFKFLSKYTKEISSNSIKKEARDIKIFKVAPC